MPNTTSNFPTSQSLDREDASKLNPLIGMCETETFERCRVIVRDLGYIMSAADSLAMPPDMSNWYQMFETVSAAMAWEIEGMEIERRYAEASDAASADAIRESITALDNGIAAISSFPENDTAATTALIRASTERAILRDRLAELESGVAK